MKFPLCLVILLYCCVWVAAQPASVPSRQIRSATQHFGFFAGYWFPSGHLEVVRNHPTFGMQWGFRHLQHSFDVTLDFRFLKSKNDYAVNRAGILYYAHDFLGGYFGIDYTYNFFVQRGKDAGILLGIGYDGFSLNREKIPGRPYEIGSLNVNAGFRLNVYTRGTTYFGIQPRYNFISYKNKGGTSFSGNAFSISAFVGGIWSGAD